MRGVEWTDLQVDVIMGLVVVFILGADSSSCGIGGCGHCHFGRRQWGPQVCWPLCLGWGKPTHMQPSDVGLSLRLCVFSGPFEKGASFCK